MSPHDPTHHHHVSDLTELPSQRSTHQKFTTPPPHQTLIDPNKRIVRLSRGGTHSLIMGASGKSWNQALSKGMVVSSISFTSVISSTIRVQIPIQPMAISAKPIASPPKKRFPSGALSRKLSSSHSNES
ncbi:hypothetical protein RJ640_006087 [Escallonia rubra]|uniref:Uncharacterized protein n=1 Tax=Escallonia rubra TaxID=112253 RepID=A0AA88QR82_9ASTE|nr:hypothetical protein RJ640_006087 [Escallonia rubra]